MASYKYNDRSRITDHFDVSEFRCKCGRSHDTVLDTLLVTKLEELRRVLGCKQIIINSGYRCPDHDRNVGGSGSGQHTLGKAADIVCYDKNGNKINSKIVSCAAQDVGFGGIANIDSSYTAVHLDVRSGKWYGDETMSTNWAVPSGNFYKHFGLTKKDVYGARTLSVSGITVDGVTYAGTLTEI